MPLLPTKFACEVLDARVDERRKMLMVKVTVVMPPFAKSIEGVLTVLDPDGKEAFKQAVTRKFDISLVGPLQHTAEVAYDEDNASHRMLRLHDPDGRPHDGRPRGYVAQARFKPVRIEYADGKVETDGHESGITIEVTPT